MFQLPRGLFSRDFRLLFAGQAASLLGDGLFSIALAFAVLEVTDSGIALGLVFAAGAVPLVGFSLVAGVWADRLERRRVMLASDAVRVVVQLALAGLVLSDRAELWHFIALQAVYGTAQAFFGPASTGLLPQVLERDLLQAANGFLGATRAATFVLGSALGGLIVHGIGPGAAIGVDSVTFAVSAGCLLVMHPTPVTTGERSAFLHELAEGFRELRRHRWLWIVILNTSFFLMLYVAPLHVLGPIVARDDLGGPIAWGIIGAAFGAGEIAGGLAAATLRLRRPMVLSAALLLVTGITPVLFALAVPVWLIALSMAVEGLAVGLFLAVWEGEIQREIPQDKLSRVSAWDWMASLSGMPIGFVLGGVLGDTVGIDATLYGMAAAGAVIAILLLAFRDIRNIGARAPV